jgi:hypothetical protein
VPLSARRPDSRHSSCTVIEIRLRCAPLLVGPGRPALRVWQALDSSSEERVQGVWPTVSTCCGTDASVGYPGDLMAAAAPPVSAPPLPSRAEGRVPKSLRSP